MVESLANTMPEDRAQIKKDLHEFARKHLENIDNYEEVDKCEKAIKVDGVDKQVFLRTCRHYDEDLKSYVMVCKGKIEGMSVAKFKAFRDNICENMVKMDPDRIKC